MEDEQHLLLLDQLAHLLHRLGRAVAVVERDEVDLAAVDAALIVDHLEIGGLGPPDRPVGGGGTAIRPDVATLGFAFRHTRALLLLVPPGIAPLRTPAPP